MTSIPPVKKAKITPTDYARYRKMGYSHDEITQEADVVAPDMAGSMLQGLPFIGTLTDELEGLAGGTGAYIAKKLRGQPATWRNEVENDQLRAERANTQLPGVSLAAGLAVPAGLSGAVDKTFKISRNAGPIARGAQAIARPALTGAVTGVTAGIGTGHGEDRLTNAFKYGVGGGALGTVMGAAPLLARYVAQFFGGDRANLASARASDAINRTVSRMGLPDDIMRSDEAQMALNRAPGPNAPILNAERMANSVALTPREMTASGKRVMDMSRPMQELSKEVASISPNAESQLESIARSRIAQEPNAVVDDMADALQVPRTATSADRAEAMLRRKVSDDDQEFTRIFNQFGRPIAASHIPGSADIQQAWNDLRPDFIGALEDEARALGVPMTRYEVQRGNGMMAPTLEGLHKAKQFLQDRVTSIASRKMPDDGKLRVYEVAIDRLRGLGAGQQGQVPPLAQVPGGAQYLDELQRSAQDRSVVDALNAGQEMKLSEQSPEQVRAAMAEAMPFGGEDVTTARRVMGGMRRGVVTNARTRAGGDGRNGLLDQALAPNTQGAMREMQPLSSGTDERMRQFAAKMEDRATMRETDRLQSLQSAKDQIIEGERPTGTALGMGQSRLLGEAAALDIKNLPGPLKLAAGALLSKFLQGQRTKATQLAADEIAQFLQLESTNPQVAQRLYDLMTNNMRRQIMDVRGGTQRAMTAPLFMRYVMGSTDR